MRFFKWHALTETIKGKLSNKITTPSSYFPTAGYYLLTMEIMKEEHANSFIALERFYLSTIEIYELHKTLYFLRKEVLKFLKTAL